MNSYFLLPLSDRRGVCPITFFVSTERVYVADGGKSKIRRQPALGDFRCSKNELTGHEMRLSRSFLPANLDC